ncbi:hypothetical protein FWK35_00003392, partial [Aphis craccivora]
NESSRCIGRSFFEFPNSFQKRREKPKKKLRNFYAKPVFDQIDFFLYDCNSKILEIFTKCLFKFSKNYDFF